MEKPRFLKAKLDSKPLWASDGSVYRIPHCLYGIRMKVIDETSKTYTLKFDEKHIYEFCKCDCEE